jgi:hypothetical protein
MFRQDSSIKASSDDKARLAHRALAVVLQHWMVPNLGWTTSMCQEKLQSLRPSILDHRFKNSSSESHGKLLLKKHLENEVGYFDEDWTAALKEQLDAMTIEAFFTTQARISKIFHMLVFCIYLHCE